MKAALESVSRRPRELLRDVEERAVAVRKLFKKFEQGQGRTVRGIMDDAVKLCLTIERLARWGQKCSAAEAVEVGFLVEIFVSQLEVEIDQIIAS
jgi:hypothetical protein